MKTIKMAIFCLIFVFSLNQSYSQWIYNFNCGMEETEGPDNPIGMGLTKPMKTLPVNDTSAYFRVLLVYVEFKGDELGSNTYWEFENPPTYADDLFAPAKLTGLNAYSGYYISDYFNKISNDQFDMIGDVKHIILPKEYSEYTSGVCYDSVMFEVLRILDTSSNPSYKADWLRYDNWRWNGSTNEFEMIDDGYIDMIYIQFRRADMCGMTSGGYGALYVDYSTINYNKEINGCGICYEGSGVMGIDGWQMPVGAAIGYFRHEYSHYTLGWHKPYSTIAGQDGTQLALGYELGFSPEDLISVGLANVTEYTGSTNSFDLEDLQTTGDVLRIPTGTTNEYFLVSSRRRIAGDGAFTWDCNMAGDTAMGEPFKQYGNYSKGLYIYHVSNGNSYDSWADLECADGLWNWSVTGSSTPDWDSQQILPTFDKTGVGYNDDDPTDNVYDNTRMSSRDGHSLDDYTYSTNTGYHNKWFSIGERHTSLGDRGVDRVFSNLNENNCARDVMGDRWDAWDTSYNEVFSPYSSPNTKKRNNDQTGIFIYYESLSSSVATVKVYQAGLGTSEEDDILEATPPSKPMLYRPFQLYTCIGGWASPRITWDNNLEPDMVRGNRVHFKRYNIYRALSSNSSVAPYNYVYAGTYDDYTPDDTANFIDNNYFTGVRVYCELGGGNYNDIYYRYKITAVDITDWESVKSDFIPVKGHPIQPDGPGPGNNESPLNFSLKQNYPNPFNPSTQISYSIPQNTFVTIKVYNAAGQLVRTLVNNEYKSAGNYDVNFDGTGLASGIYFYSLDAGINKDVKKMVLVK